MELIGFPLSYRMTACLMVLEAAQVDHKVQWISFEDLKSERIMKFNPQGKIPILVTPEGPIYESMAIIRHVARVSGKLGGSTPHEEALIDQWLSWTNTEVAPLLASFWYQTAGFALPSISYKAEDITRGKEAFLHALTLTTISQTRNFWLEPLTLLLTSHCYLTCTNPSHSHLLRKKETQSRT